SMSNPNLKPSTRATVVAALASASRSVGAATTSAVDMSQYENVQAIISVGAFGTDATATLKWQQATDTDFSDAKDITARSAIDLAEELPGVINLKATELDVNGGFRYVRAVLTIGTAAVHAGGVILAHDAKN
ncbi:hypothetical protein Q4595_20725, partial [Wenyingzhuangia sp. 1_MG-2023]|nr:hypothetical protein [Wenyingzhuangia sp. 1_MG-2023]